MIIKSYNLLRKSVCQARRNVFENKQRDTAKYSKMEPIFEQNRVTFALFTLCLNTKKINTFYIRYKQTHVLKKAAIVFN